MIPLTECGAVEGQPCDTALRIAVDHAKEERHSTILIDGSFKITQRSDFSFLNSQGKHLILKGEGARSRLIPSFHPSVQGLVFQNLESLVLQDFVIAGNGNDREYDCGTLFWLTTIKQIVWEGVHIYGLATPESNPFGLVFIAEASFDFSRSLISGSTAVNSSLFTFNRFRRVHLKGPGSDVMDYGELSGGQGGSTFQSKTSLGFTHSWFKFTNPIPANETSYLGIPLIESMVLDEGARYAVFCDGGAGWIRGVEFKDVGINVRHSGLLFNRVEDVLINKSYFTWQTNPCLAIEGKDVKRMRLVRCHADKKATDIKIEGRYEDLLLEDCYGFKNVHVPGTFRTVRNGKQLP